MFQPALSLTAPAQHAPVGSDVDVPVALIGDRVLTFNPTEHGNLLVTRRHNAEPTDLPREIAASVAKRLHTLGYEVVSLGGSPQPWVDTYIPADKAGDGFCDLSDIITHREESGGGAPIAVVIPSVIDTGLHMWGMEPEWKAALEHVVVDGPAVGVHLVVSSDPPVAPVGDTEPPLMRDDRWESKLCLVVGHGSDCKVGTFGGRWGFEGETYAGWPEPV